MKNLTVYNECNEREINSMVGKAAYAWANWQDAKNYTAFAIEMNDEYCKAISEKSETAYASEYEATARCIDMFVRESLYEIQHCIIERAEAEFFGDTEETMREDMDVYAL